MFGEHSWLSSKLILPNFGTWRHSHRHMSRPACDFGFSRSWIGASLLAFQRIPDLNVLLLCDIVDAVSSCISFFLFFILPLWWYVPGR
jgi:hypothetical protein